ncbi:unnamed protein product [Arabidopsis lyrata]|nr:unnamed protein product [Arabidopsis lyrata]
MVSLVFRRTLEVLIIVPVIVILRTRCRHVAFLLQWVILFVWVEPLKCLVTRRLKEYLLYVLARNVYIFVIKLLIMKFRFYHFLVLSLAVGWVTV